jgi:hypothetical protein
MKASGKTLETDTLEAHTARMPTGPAVGLTPSKECEMSSNPSTSKSVFKPAARTRANAAFCACVLATLVSACVQTQSSRADVHADTQADIQANIHAGRAQLHIVKAQQITVLGSRQKREQAAPVTGAPASQAAQTPIEVATQVRMKSAPAEN